MKLPFYKYQGAGNDFVMVDNRQTTYLTVDQQTVIHRLCDRRFGIGGDGLILLQNHEGYDFEMIYFNADGTEGSLCGNGGRCTVAFAKQLGIIQNQTTFLAIDGPHEATINEAGNWVELKMGDVEKVHQRKGDFELNTGSPHYIQFVEQLQSVDVFQAGRAIRYNDIYAEKGINVNFVEPTKQGFSIRTYERGVEDETLACGTGVTAAAIAYAKNHPTQAKKLLQNGGIPVKAQGGDLKVRFEQNGTIFEHIWLCGPATFVYMGTIEM
ncbi:MAG: diaminopimelate epimerase [Bacteroidota bacterium]